MVKNAEIISSICMLLLVVPMYFYMRHITNYVYAIIAVALIQLNFYYIYYGPTPYTESCFLLMLVSCLLLTYKLDIKRSNYIVFAAALGIFSGLIFLSRQIGITFICFLMMWYIINIIIYRNDKDKLTSSLKKAGIVFIFWTVIFLPYASLLYIQTQQSPLQQYFRMNQYVVQTQAPETITEYNEINSIPSEDYAFIYHKRRLLRKLTPDASEMLSHVQVNDSEANDSITQKPVDRSSQILTGLLNPLQLSTKIVNNIYYLNVPLGLAGFCLFICSLITPFVIRSSKIANSTRLLIPAFMLVYLIATSIAGDLISSRHENPTSL